MVIIISEREYVFADIKEGINKNSFLINLAEITWLGSPY